MRFSKILRAAVFALVSLPGLFASASLDAQDLKRGGEVAGVQADPAQLGDQRANALRQDDKTLERKFLRERARFRALLLKNPNYFGNLKESKFVPVFDIQGNTTFEEIGCVGFQPQFDRLHAVVYVNQPYGYGGGLCRDGTPEYVRFFLSYDAGATWEDQGATSFRAYDVPEGTKGNERLEYAVTLDVRPRKRPCFAPNIILARAILSWNQLPPAGDPNFTPIWGNVHDTHIQIDPRDIILLDDLLSSLDVKLPQQIATAVDLTEELKTAAPKTLGAPELAVLYKDQGVEKHRFAMSALKSYIEQPALADSVADLIADLDLGDIVDDLFPDQGSTRYEELECIGLDPREESLVGVLRVKLPSGYSGGPCTAGSKEYVTFWGDTDLNGSYETCFGTTSVNAHDFKRIPKGGLEYSVFLPVDLKRYRKPCAHEPVLIGVRAILSWQSPASCTDPDHVPTWGNQLDTLVLVPPGPVLPPDVFTPFIETVGGMSVDDISSATGLANGTAVTSGFTAQDSPFGGLVVVTGHLANPPDLSSGATPLKYQVLVRKLGSPWQTVTNSFALHRSQLLGGSWSSLPVLTQSADAAGFYTYREDLTNGGGNPQHFVVGNLLARWQTSGLTGHWQLRIVAQDAGGILWYGNLVNLRIDSEAPVSSITITTGGGPCADFDKGATVAGTYTVADEHFGRLSLSVAPSGPANGTAPVPGARGYPLVPTGGETRAWSLDTSLMDVCGYTVRIHVRDRTIVNSGSVGRHNSASVGLCLRE